MVGPNCRMVAVAEPPIASPHLGQITIVGVRVSSSSQQSDSASGSPGPRETWRHSPLSGSGTSPRLSGSHGFPALQAWSLESVFREPAPPRAPAPGPAGRSPEVMRPLRAQARTAPRTAAGTPRCSALSSRASYTDARKPRGGSGTVSASARRALPLKRRSGKMPVA